MLATIRNLLIWTDIVILSILFKIHFVNNITHSDRASWLIQLLRVGNFLLWFYIAVVKGTDLTNSSFNLGYNCLESSWIILSGYLLIVSLVCGFIGLQIYDRLSWEGKYKNKDVKSSQ